MSVKFKIKDVGFGINKVNLYVKKFLIWRKFPYCMERDRAEALIKDIESGNYKRIPDLWIVRKAEKLKHIIESCVLCVRYPFLYPRNRFSGTHYTNWTLMEHIKNINNKYCVFVCYKKGDSDVPEIPAVAWYNNIKKSEHFDMFGHYWTNFWALPYTNVLRFIHDYILQILHFIPTHTELDAMDTGWRKAFGLKLCEELKRALLKNGRKCLRSYRVMQIKEKYGGLCWYDNWNTDEGYAVIRKYEDLSERTCIVCGKPAEYISRGWISPYCSEHINGENAIPIDEYFNPSDDGDEECCVAGGATPVDTRFVGTN